MAILLSTGVVSVFASEHLNAQEGDGIEIHTSCGTTFTIPKKGIESADEVAELAKEIDRLDCGSAEN